MSVILFIGLGIGIASFIGLAVFGLVLWFKEPEQIEDDTYLLNFMSYRSNGHAFGVIKGIERGEGGRWKVKFDPKDVKSQDIIKKKWKSQEIIYDSNKFVNISKEEFSGHRNFAIGLPPTAEDIPEHLRKTELGKWAMFMTEKKNLEKNLVQTLRTGIDRRDKIATDIGTGELSEVWMENMKAFFIDDIKETIMKSSKDKSSFSSTDAIKRFGS